MTVQHMASMTRQWSTGISVGFVVLTLLITTRALAGMLGGSFIAYLVALGIIGALVVLMSSVILAQFHQGDLTAERKDAPLTLSVQPHSSDAA